jgi:hypothetical protein
MASMLAPIKRLWPERSATVECIVISSWGLSAFIDAAYVSGHIQSSNNLRVKYRQDGLWDRYR